MDWPSLILGLILGASLGFGAFYIYMRRVTNKMLKDMENFDKILESLKNIKR